MNSWSGRPVLPRPTPVPKTGGVPLPLQSDILEQYKRIELSLIAWEAIVLPLN